MSRQQDQNESTARPVFRVLAGVMVAASVFAGAMSAKPFYMTRGNFDFLVLCSSIFGICCFGHVVLTGKWLWPLRQYRRRNQGSR
jgi:hypothetical protein